MAVKFKININDVMSSGGTINIPLGQEFIPIDQSEIIDRKVVTPALESVINPIVDYDSVKYKPYYYNNNFINKIYYEVGFNNGNTYNDIGYEQADIDFNRNNIKKSHLKLSFYDSDKPNIANLLFELILYPNPQDINDNVVLKALDPLSFQNEVTGYFIYYKRVDTIKSVYMKGEYNNAKTGISHKLNVSQSLLLSANEVINNLFFKFDLINDNGVYKYIIDTSYNNTGNNIYYTNNELHVKLFEIEVQ